MGQDEFLGRVSLDEAGVDRRENRAEAGVLTEAAEGRDRSV